MRKFEIVEKDVSAVDVAFEVAANVAGVAFGTGVGFYASTMLPVAKGLGQIILREATVKLGSIVAGAIGANTLRTQAEEIREVAELARLKRKGLLDSNEKEDEESATE